MPGFAGITSAALPVYVRAGAIIPMEPLVESTSEIPVGPLTLRVYAGDNCFGELYQDDGKSFAFEKGGFLRESFACRLKSNSMRLRIGSREGTYPAWWKEIHVEIYGWTPAKGQIIVNSAAANVPIGKQGDGIGFSIRDDGEVHDVEVR